jgi:hypothetical protein
MWQQAEGVDCELAILQWMSRSSGMGCSRAKHYSEDNYCNNATGAPGNSTRGRNEEDKM